MVLTAVGFCRANESPTVFEGCVMPRHPSERGTALLEFSIVLSLLILIAIGVTEFGRVFSELLWFSQSSYNTALIGASVDIDLAPQAMGQRYNQNITVKNKYLKNATLVDIETSPERKEMRVRAQANIPFFFENAAAKFLGRSELAFDMEIVTPLLVTGPSDTSEEMIRFENKTPYNCSFSAGSYSPTPCYYADVLSVPGSPLGPGETIPIYQELSTINAQLGSSSTGEL